MKNIEMLAPDWYASGAVELGMNAKTAIKIDQKNAQCAQEQTQLVNINVESRDVVKKGESCESMLLPNALIVKAIIKPI